MHLFEKPKSFLFLIPSLKFSFIFFFVLLLWAGVLLCIVWGSAVTLNILTNVHVGHHVRVQIKSVHSEVN
jgi:hypothetical protein